jgi:hypothetical protein
MSKTPKSDQIRALRERLVFPIAKTFHDKIAPVLNGGWTDVVTEGRTLEITPKPKRGRPRKTPEGFDRAAYMRQYMKLYNKRKRVEKARSDANS